ncbi:peroxiredoxin [uncultured Pelagimonas sp.]|uniref:peroxiredoxin n=1 Tax=uncultured Pelagimonas sp. TaxID=1618102 RepID=UPI00260204AB|nr:peroxiredoxin [uncultured Pelagimonas sp.]
MSDTVLTPAPEFSLPSSTGEDVSSADLRGNPAVLFFYPRDNTPGCTTENLDFTALYPEYQALNCSVFGISKDSMESHEKFISKKALAVPLLSDEHSTACEDFGVWVEKKMYGKVFMGIQRATFLIDGDGQIVREWRKVKVKEHAAEVLQAVKDLTAG